MFRRSFVKIPNKKFHEKPSGGNKAVPCGRMEGYYEAKSRYLRTRLVTYQHLKA